MNYLTIIPNGENTIALWTKEPIGDITVSQSGEIGINTPRVYASGILQDYCAPLNSLRLCLSEGEWEHTDHLGDKEAMVYIHNSSYGGDAGKVTFSTSMTKEELKEEYSGLLFV